jgi:hypothetical protein
MRKDTPAEAVVKEPGRAGLALLLWSIWLSGVGGRMSRNPAVQNRESPPVGLSQGFSGFCTTSSEFLMFRPVVQKPLNHRGEPGGVLLNH